AGGPVSGYMGATGANLLSGSLYGMQLACGYNSASDVSGLQLGGAANRARDVSGVQLAGAANVAENVAGVQLGLVNVGRRVSGLQLGLVNVADSSSASVGLVNVISDGIHDVAGEYSELGAAFVVRLGGRRMYTLLTLGSTDGRAAVPGLKFSS